MPSGDGEKTATAGQHFWGFGAGANLYERLTHGHGFAAQRRIGTLGRLRPAAGLHPSEYFLARGAAS